MRRLIRSLFPGTAQLALGHRAAGLLLLGAWLALFAAGMCAVTPFWRMQLLGLLAAVRAIAAIDLAFACNRDETNITQAALLNGLLLFALVDTPLWLSLHGPGE